MVHFLINQILRELLKTFDMGDCKEIVTPMTTSCYLDADEKGTNVEQTKYRGKIGSLLYLTACRPNIMFSVCLCARYQANLRSHTTWQQRES